jgi:LysM repeat protein
MRKREKNCHFRNRIAGALLLASSFNGSAQQNPRDSLGNYPWIHPELNHIQFYDADVLKAFYKKWSASNGKPLTIAHFGDSHVQPDIYPGELRKELQQVKGDAGFGMLFPFSTANTYSMNDYKSTHTGKWLYAKSIESTPNLPLGVMGATSRTTDSNASFTIEFREQPSLSYKRLKIFCKMQRISYDLVIKSGGKETHVAVDSTGGGPTCLETTLPVIGSTITVQLVRKNPYESEFEFYGMSLENEKPEGLMLHCLGIGGSQYGSLLQEVLFEEQLPVLQPDLVILDFGTNDFLYKNKIPSTLEDQIVQVIARVRKTAPDAMVLLTSAQDMNRKGRNVTAGALFSDLIRKIAKEQKCPFYDWYWISGGPKTMVMWSDFGIGRKDMVHLTPKGYKIKGSMLAEALLESMKMMGDKDHPDSMILDLHKYRHENDSLDSLSIKTLEGNSPPKPTDPPKKVVQYKVKAGETLGGIAKKYHTTVEQLKKLNGMKGTTIYAGQYLIVGKTTIKPKTTKPPTGK